jgi:chemotaxis protein MotA
LFVALLGKKGSKSRANPIPGASAANLARPGGKRLPKTAKFRRSLKRAPERPFFRARRRSQMIQILDPLSAAIVFGGTAAATVLRCGWRDSRAAVQALGQMFMPAFDSGRVRAELAVHIQEIGEDGLIRAAPHRFGDGEFDDLSEALVRHRSITALYDEHERHRGRRIALAGAADRALSEAAELAPVLGLVGTLVALALFSAAMDNGGYAHAIGTALTATLYGLIAANFLFAPLAGAIERRARAEERARQELLQWLASAIEAVAPQTPKQAAPKAAA